MSFFCVRLFELYTNSTLTDGLFLSLGIAIANLVVILALPVSHSDGAAASEY